MTEIEWIESQLNYDVWVHTLLNKKSYVLTNSYNFLLSGKRLIQRLLSWYQNESHEFNR